MTTLNEEEYKYLYDVLIPYNLEVLSKENNSEIGDKK